MAYTTLIKNARIINQGESFTGSILIIDDEINRIYKTQDVDYQGTIDKLINATGLICIPGIIDDQVHFREPGLTHKADIRSESRAAVAGGITSFMEMPNTNPQTTTIELLEEKYEIAAKNSATNYSFYLGGTNSNIDEIKKLDPGLVCGIKVFMGSSTGNMLVDNPDSLAQIFEHSPCLIAVHCEDEETIKRNTETYFKEYGEDVPIKYHCHIRSEEACYKSSKLAVDLAKKYNSRLHVLHVSTGKELSLFEPDLPASEKKITSEVCVHHLWFSESDYSKYGTRIKWNPSIKTYKDKEALIDGVNKGSVDIIATDHAPHLLEEKENKYFKAPSGGPLVQHSLQVMLELFHQGKISLDKIVSKMCHTPADIFNINKRGYIKEGYYADLTLIDLNHPNKVEKDSLLYKCKWSPFEGMTFNSKVIHTFVNGKHVFDDGKIMDGIYGKRLTFNR